MGWRWAALVLLLTGCSGAAGWIEPRVRLEAPGADVFVVRGRSATVSVALVPESGLAEVAGTRARLDALGAPRGVEVVLAPSYAEVGQRVEVHLYASPSAPLGDHTLHLLATGPYNQAETTLRMVIR